MPDDGPGAPVVRDARAGDAPAIRALTLAAYAEYGAVMAPAAWAGLSRSVRGALDAAEQGTPVERIVAERHGAIVGSVFLYPPDTGAYGAVAGASPWPELRLLAVDPAARGQGIGERLVHECVRRVRAAGLPALGLHSSVSMAGAIRMYRRLGFRRAPEHDFQPPGAELVEGYVLPIAGAGG